MAQSSRERRPAGRQGRLYRFALVTENELRVFWIANGGQTNWQQWQLMQSISWYLSLACLLHMLSVLHSLNVAQEQAGSVRRASCAWREQWHANDPVVLVSRSVTGRAKRILAAQDDDASSAPDPIFK